MHKKPKKYSVFSLINNAVSYHENWQPVWRSPEPKKEYDAIIIGGGGHGIPIREVRLSSGAEFIVVVCGEIMTMPGLPSVPAANSIHLNMNGQIEGLF